LNNDDGKAFLGQRLNQRFALVDDMGLGRCLDDAGHAG
jgi:hypothetical protein